MDEIEGKTFRMKVLEHQQPCANCGGVLIWRAGSSVIDHVLGDPDCDDPRPFRAGEAVFVDFDGEVS